MNSFKMNSSNSSFELVYFWWRSFFKNHPYLITYYHVLLCLPFIFSIFSEVFLIIFLLIDKTDEFQLVSFILQFKA